MDAYTTGRKHVRGRLTIEETIDRVVVKFSEPVTELRLTADETRMLEEEFARRRRSISPIIVPGDLGKLPKDATPSGAVRLRSVLPFHA